MKTKRNPLPVLVCILASFALPISAQSAPLYHAVAELTIGADGAVPDGVMLERVSGLAFDRYGHIVVSDYRANALWVFSPSGQKQYRLGQTGAGPGDLSRPCCIAVATDGTLWVEDAGNHRYSVFTLGRSSGSFVRSILMPTVSANEANRITWDSRGFLIHALSTSMRVGAPGLVRTKLDLTGKSVATDTTRGAPADSTNVAKLVRDFGGGRTSRTEVYRPFGPIDLRALGPGGSTALAVSSNYAVAWLDDAHRLVAQVGRTVTPPAVSSNEAQAAEKQLADAAASMHAPRSEIPFGVPRTKAPLESLGFDLDGRLWVELSVADGAAHAADVYERTGRWTARMTWPAEVRLPYLVVHGQRGLGVSTDSLGVEHVVVLRFVRG